MITIGTAALGAQRRRPIDVHGDTFYKGEWMDTGTDLQLSPTVFLAEQPANVTLRTHFHGANQFQLVTHGGGTIGKDQLVPRAVHYAGAFTGYGPIVAGPEGLKYFTIRCLFETGNKTSIDEMVRGPKRHLTAAPPQAITDQQLRALAEVEEHVMIAPQEDCVAATLLRVPPNGETIGPDPARAHGQFFFVTQGTLRHQDLTLAAWESVFVSRDEPALRLVAGDAGVELLCLEFAAMEPVYTAARNAAMAAA